MKKLQKFMIGRYGIDDLYTGLFLLWVLLFLINIFCNNIILNIGEFGIIFIMFYRCFSKKIDKRKNENQRFLKLKNKILKPWLRWYHNIKDKDHIYKKCPKCKTILKLPLPMERGIKHSKCPKCGKRVTILVLKCQKVEFIKNKK